MTVRCKFKCISAETQDKSLWDETHQEHIGDGPAYAYKFQVVYGGSPENDRFFSSTPGGTLEISAVRKQEFEVGKEYYLDLSPAQVAEDIPF